MEHPENSAEYAGLQVNSGVAQPSIINPYLKRKKRKELTVAEMVEGIRKGDVTTLSQAVTLVESVNPDHQQRAQEVIEKCLPYSGNSVRVGISGVPGAGKSTSIDEFGMHVLKEKGGKLAVLAIDPSSERSKGSILGDKTRMEQATVTVYCDMSLMLAYKAIYQTAQTVSQQMGSEVTTKLSTLR